MPDGWLVLVKPGRNRLRQGQGTALPIPFPMCDRKSLKFKIWVVVNIRVPFWVLIIVWHLIIRVSQKGPSF